MEQMTHEEAVAELEKERERGRRLQAVVDAQEKRAQSLTLKVSAKGAVSLYGMGRFPITHYPDQWLKILAIAEQIKGFIQENKEKLSFKN